MQHRISKLSCSNSVHWRVGEIRSHTLVEPLAAILSSAARARRVNRRVVRQNFLAVGRSVIICDRAKGVELRWAQWR